MLNRTMLSRVVPLVAVAALMLAGCNETSSTTAKDVTKAREDASQDVSAAREKAIQTEIKAEEKVVDAQQEYAQTNASGREELTEVQSKALSDTAKADFDVAIAKAQGIEDVAGEKCDVLDGAEKTACLSAAAATYAASEAKAIADRDAALLASAQYP